MVASTKKEALRNSISYEKWQAYGIAVMDYKNYQNLSPLEKEKTVFETICSGLYDIAEIDKLDKDIIGKVIAEIKQNGLKTELIYYSGKNEKYEVKISYFAVKWEEGSSVYLSIKEKTSGKQVKKILGKVTDSVELHYWLNKITLTHSMLKIKSSKSFKASLYVKEKPQLLKFKLNEQFF